MPIQKLYRVQCGGCLLFLPPPLVFVSVAVAPSATPLFTSYQDAVDAAADRDWKPGPLCPACATEGVWR